MLITLSMKPGVLIVEFQTSPVLRYLQTRVSHKIFRFENESCLSISQTAETDLPCLLSSSFFEEKKPKDVFHYVCGTPKRLIGMPRDGVIGQWSAARNSGLFPSTFASYPRSCFMFSSTHGYVLLFEGRSVKEITREMCLKIDLSLKRICAVQMKLRKHIGVL